MFEAILFWSNLIVYGEMGQRLFPLTSVKPLGALPSVMAGLLLFWQAKKVAMFWLKKTEMFWLSIYSKQKK